tara:strand:- start:102 stop:530 length:429 start_codon:yes stop_codon:yes gene_type:complete
VGELAHPLEIRAHHLLCLLGFRGLGYSLEFTKKMGKVAEELRVNSTFPITILTECDVICASCPHNKDNKCCKKPYSELKVKARDLEVLRRIGLTTGTHISLDTIWARIKERLTPEDLVLICQGCEWLELGYCAKGLEVLETS